MAKAKNYLVCLFLCVSSTVWAGEQIEETLALHTKMLLQKSISDSQPLDIPEDIKHESDAWVHAFSPVVSKYVPDDKYREPFLYAVYYEAHRAGIDPQLVLGVIHVESRFRKYAVSVAGARGYMQVMPFWTNLLDNADANLFHMRLNLRYGCTILRYYLDKEHGNIRRALGRYNGSLGENRYPDLVLSTWYKYKLLLSRSPHT